MMKKYTKYTWQTMGLIIVTFITAPFVYMVFTGLLKLWGDIFKGKI